MMYAVIMAGGSGTRFWPRSRRRLPKQLIEIFGRGSLIQQTAARLHAGIPPEALYVITGREILDEVRRQLPQVPAEQIIAEPVGRDTAACIGLAGMLLRKKDPQAVMAVVPADHAISPDDEFMRALQQGAAVAETRNVLVTFGIKPTEPNTAYGYIQRGAPIDKAPGVRAAFRVAAFKEKPNRETAAQYLAAGDYYWNSGLFVWRAQDILHAMQKLLPDLYAGLARLEPDLATARQAESLEKHFPSLQRISIDFGIMERADNAVVMEAGFSWDDVGCWDCVARHQPGDANANYIVGRHHGIDTRDCIMVSDQNHLVATIGVKDLVIVHTPDVTLVCDRRRAGEVKALVELLRSQGLETHL